MDGKVEGMDVREQEPQLGVTEGAGGEPTFRMPLRKQAELPESVLFPEGHLTLIVGHPGTGKSLLGLHLAARVSVHAPMPPWGCVGDPMPEEADVQSYQKEQAPGSALIFSREDDAFTIKSRLAVALGGNAARPGADMRYVRLMEGSLVLPPREARPDPERGSPPRRSSLHYAIQGGPVHYARTKLVVIDPLPAFLKHIDGTNNPGLIRESLEPLMEYAARYRIAVVGISHVHKGADRGLVQRAARSYAYTAVARSVLLVMDDEKERDRRLVVPIKNNLADVPGAYAFRIRQMVPREAVERMPDPHYFGRGIGGNVLPVPYIEWEEGCVAGFEGVRVTEAERVEKLQVEEAQDFLRVVLAEGEVASSQVLKEARSVGISLRTLRRAMGTKEEPFTKARREGGRWWVRMAGG